MCESDNKAICDGDYEPKVVCILGSTPHLEEEKTDYSFVALSISHVAQLLICHSARSSRRYHLPERQNGMKGIFRAY